MEEERNGLLPFLDVFVKHEWALSLLLYIVNLLPLCILNTNYLSFFFFLSLNYLVWSLESSELLSAWSGFHEEGA